MTTLNRIKHVLRTGGVISALLFLSTNFVLAEELSFGWEDWQPYQYKDSDGQVTGLDIELSQAIFGNFDYQLALQEMPWKRHLNSIEDGSTDIAASASKTPEREEYALFSDPYRTESAVMYIRKADAGIYKFDSLEDIIGSEFKLAVTRGYYYGEEFGELMKNSEFKKNIREVNDNQLAQRQLSLNRVDGFLEDPIAATLELKEEGLLDKVEILMPVYSDNIYIMFSKKSVSPDIVKSFNSSLAELRANGVYDQIMNKYLN
jgi:polar amino acid transport system substrate-binding protein